MPETSYSVDLDEYRLRALLEFLDKDETLISDTLNDALDKLYKEIVPLELKEKVETAKEYDRNHDRLNGNKFSIVHMSDGESNYYLTTKDIQSFFDAACLYADRFDDVAGYYTLDTMMSYLENRDLIGENVFKVLSEAREKDDRIQVEVHYDFDSATLEFIEPNGEAYGFDMNVIPSLVQESRDSSEWEHEQCERFDELSYAYIQEVSGQTF